MRQQFRVWLTGLLLSGSVLAQAGGICDPAADGLMAPGLIAPSGVLDMRATITNKGDTVVSLAELRSRTVIPDVAWNLYRRALKADRKGAYAAAAGLVGSAVNLSPDFFQAHAALAVSYLRNRDLEAAKKEIHTALSLDPGYLPGRELLGIAAFLSGDVVEAAAMLEEVLKNGPRRPLTHYFLALALCKMNQCHSAREHFDLAQRLRRHPPRQSLNSTTTDPKSRPVTALRTALLDRFGV
ncbi:MAG: hypothetical protein M3Z35_09520 [Nitrospirota bacterium]|nr:hypothetical protein [Nitrospirota bacterium]